MSNEDIKINEKRKSSFSLLCSTHSKVCLLITSQIVLITIIMALVIQSPPEQLALFQIIKNGFIFQNKEKDPLFVLSHGLGNRN